MASQISHYSETWLRDDLISTQLYTDSENDQGWLTHLRTETERHSNPYIKVKIFTLQVVKEEIIRPIKDRS